jgi:RHS repeat-associated protein
VSFDIVFDFESPVITLTSPASDSATTASMVQFIGSVSEPVSLTLDGVVVALDESLAFDHGPVSLDEGQNRFELVATDAGGNLSSQTVRVLRDGTPPGLSFIAPTEGTYFDPNVQPFEIRWGDSGTAVDIASLQLTVDGAPLAVTCTACGSGAVCTATTPPAGTVVLGATVADGVGLTASAQVRFTTDPNGDIVAPQILLLAPTSGTATDRSEERFIGDLSEAATLTIGGAPAAVDANHHFDHSPVPLSEGANTIELRATDAAGNVGTLTVALTLDSAPPPPVDVSLVTVGASAGGQVTVTGAAGSVTPVDAGDAVHIENRYSSSASEADLAVDGSFSAVLAAEGGDELALFTRDAAGNRSASRLATVPGTPALPPDPSAVAPALDPTAATGPCQLYEFLYTGAAPIQAGVAADAIDCRGASLLRGRVLDRGGQPVSGVRISVLRGAELGSTLTRGDGVFDFVVPGGSEVVLQFLGTGHLPVHRKVSAPYGTSTTVPDVVLTALDTAVTTVDASGGATTMQVARGGAVTDADGTRRATLLFPAGATARLRYTGGAVEFVASLAIRATEYTVGPEGPAAMPAPLPPTSAYTYAVELSADEALSAGASSLELDRPVLSYTENFLGLPTGVVIPVGYYDRELGRWVAEENGRVIEILSSTGGLADLDVDGTGAPADATRLAELGITDAERTELVTLYSVGQSLWRVRLSHFTPYDYNLPFYPPPGAASPSRPKPRGGDQDKKPCDWTTAGSIIECTNQVLGEDVGVTGTSHSLHYRSDRVPGRKSARTLEVSLSGGSPPASVQRIDLTVDVAGKQLTQGFTPGADLSHSFTWDGRDAFGRTVQGATEATVSVGYVYDATYARPPEDELDAFARAGTSALTANSARDEITLWQRHRVEIGGWDALAQVRLGGWTLSPHHAYDPHSRTLYYGDGGRRTVKDLTVITSAAGTGEPGFAGDDGPADEARLSSPNAIVLSRDAAGTPDGGYYFADTRNCRVRHVDVAGVITTVAGSGCRYAENGLNSAGASGDGGPATAATLHWKLGQIAQGPDGSLYISDAGHTLIRRVTPDGIINTVIGWDWIHGAEPGPTPPTQLQFINLAFGLTVDDAGDIYVGEQNLVNGGVVYRFAYPIYEPEIFLQGKVGTTTNDTGLLHYLRLPHYLAFDVGGNLYISDGWSNSIFWRGWDGSFIELAGGCQTRPDGEFTCTGDAGDGGPATDALLNFPIGISFAADGSVLFVDSGNHRVRRIDSMGRISTVAGTGAPGFNGDGRAARQTQLSAPVGLEVLPEGDVLVADADNNRVRKIRGVLPPVPTTGLILVPEQDGRTRYVFDPTGRHLRTENARTGEVLLTFGYTANGHLSLVTDVFGSTITIERDASGAPQRLVAPFGHETDLAVHPSGYLATIVNPAGEPIGLTYDPEGLLTGLTDPRSNVYTFEYDNLGRLRKDTDPATGSTTLARTELPTAGDVADGFEVTKTTALGRTTRYRTEKLTTGDTRVTVTDSTGLSAVGVQGADGSHATTAPDGTVASAAPGPDPVFGMQTPRLDRFTMTTPGGLSSTATTSRAVSLVNPLGDPDDLANVATVTQTVTVNGKSGTSVLDLVNHLATTTSPEGRASITTYDAFGRLVESSMPGLEPVQYSYDGQGRLQSVSQGPRTMTYTYDATSGFLAKVADTASREVAFTYDAAGRMRTRTLPDLRVVALNYDTNGNLTSVTPPGRPPHVFGHTSVDLVDTYTPPDIGLSQHATVLTYNRDRQVELVTRPDGQTIDPVYDPDSGRRTSVVTPRGSYNYTYDGTSGNLAGVTDPEGGALGFDYDGSLLTSVTWTGEVTGSVEVAHDDDFEIVARSINGADTISYTYDEDGLLTGAGSLTISREADTGFIAATNAGGIADSYTYDPSFGELASYSAVDGGSDLYIASYSRDEVGRIVQKVETLGGAVTTYDYTFSAAGQLTDVDQNGVGLAHYDYDPNANRIAWSDYWGAGTATYDAQDRLTDYAGTTYTYTANGELASKSAGGQTVTYDYDVSGNLRRVVLPDGLTLDYVIDAANRRIGKKVNGSLVQGFLYQGPLNPVAELDGSGVVVSTFVYASKGHVPDLMMKDGATYRIVSDHLGSVRLVVDTTDGTVAQRLDYDAFGRVTFDSNPGFQPFGFAGGLYDRQIGLVRFGARDYDPETGRWTSKDPIGFAGGDLNLYGYVANDPINGNDSSGLYRVDVHYHKTKQWAMEEGFLESEAEVIAAANQGHDAGWWQPFNGLSAFSHFRDTNDVLDDIWSAIPGHDLEYFGFLLHELQDSYSHAGYKAHSGGHALRWEYLAALFLPGRSPLDNYMVQANHPDNYDGGSERDRRMECMTRFLLQLLRGHLDTNTF